MSFQSTSEILVFSIAIRNSLYCDTCDRISPLVKKVHYILPHLHRCTLLHTVYRCLIPDYAVCRAATTISRAPNKFRMYA